MQMVISTRVRPRGFLLTMKGKAMRKEKSYLLTSVFQSESLNRAEGEERRAGMLIGSSSQQSFTANAVAQLINKHSYNHKRSILPPLYFCRRQTGVSSQEEERSSRNENKLAKVAIVTLAAGVLSLGSVGDAAAAKSGGRVGGQAFRSAAPRSAPRINNNNSRTNIYVNPPPVAPPLVGGYGYGYGVPFYGGWGWSPFSFFTPGPSVAIGFGGGFDTLLLFMVLGAVGAVVRRFLGSRDETDDDY